MPMRAKRPCPHPRCPNLTNGGRCPQHRTTRQHAPGQREFYGSTYWKRLRAEVLVDNPLCVLCAEQGRTTVATVVDHRDGDWTRNDPDNLRGLCARCNASHTGRQHQAKRERP